MIMLVLMKGSEEIQLVSEGGRFILANGDVVSPAFEGWSSGEYLLVPHTPAPPPQTDPAEALAAERAAMRLTFSQLMIGLVSEGWITEAEGDAWLDGTLPAPVLALIATLPEAEQFPTRARAKRLIEAQRLDPLVIGLAQAEGKSDAELDAFFLTYAQV